MARIRGLKPDFFKDEDLAELPFQVRLFYQGLWCFADKKGRLEDRPKYLKAEIFPYDRADVEKMLGLLENPKLKDRPGKTFIRRYTINGRQYIEIIEFSKHQKPHHTERESGIPEFNGSVTVTPRISQEEYGKDCGSDKGEGKEEGKDYSQTSNEVRLSGLLYELILERDPKYKNPDFQKWADDIDKLIRLDKRTAEEIETVLRWSQRDSFWQGNILSTSKLRKQFSALKMKMEQKGDNRGKGNTGAVEPEEGKYARVGQK